MELFTTLVNLIAWAAIAVGLLIGAWYVIGLYWVHGRREEGELPEISLPGHIHEVFTGIPAALVIFYIFIAISSISYVAYIWLRGISY